MMMRFHVSNGGERVRGPLWLLLEQWRRFTIRTSFPLGCCDQSNFPLCFSNQLGSQSAHSSKSCYRSSIGQLQEPSVKLWLAVQWHLSFFPWEHVFLEFLTWLIKYFSMHLQLSNGKQMSPQQETRPYIISMAFHYAAMITSLCVTIIICSLMERDSNSSSYDWSS
jgi:hypothetical protein